MDSILPCPSCQQAEWRCVGYHGQAPQGKGGICLSSVGNKSGCFLWHHLSRTYGLYISFYVQYSISKSVCWCTQCKKTAVISGSRYIDISPHILMCSVESPINRSTSQPLSARESWKASLTLALSPSSGRIASRSSCLATKITGTETETAMAIWGCS